MKIAPVTKWQLTETAFDKLLAALAEDRETAGENYLRLKKNLTRFFETRGIYDADEAADEVFNRLTRKLETERLENINTYALGIARMLALELRRAPEQKFSNELSDIGVEPFDAEREEHDEKLKCLDKCLEELPPENREIIIKYYEGEKRGKIENRNQLAEKLGIPNNALRNRAVRLRDKLENCITNCLRKS